MTVEERTFTKTLTFRQEAGWLQIMPESTLYAVCADKKGDDAR